MKFLQKAAVFSLIALPLSNLVAPLAKAEDPMQERKELCFAGLAIGGLSGALTGLILSDVKPGAIGGGAAVGAGIGCFLLGGGQVDAATLDGDNLANVVSTRHKRRKLPLAAATASADASLQTKATQPGASAL